jgi:preprotein translocase subunit YajC
VPFLFFATTAMAQTAGAAPTGGKPSTIETFLPFVLMFVVMYFLIIRPQQKKAKDHASLLGGLKPGDEVVTSGGIIGKVRAVAETFVTLEVSNNTAIKVLKSNVSAYTVKPVAATPAGKEQPAKA